MNSIDIALIVLLVLATVRGLWRGLIRECFGFIALIGGLLAALKFSDVGAAALGRTTGLPPPTVAAIAFVAIFMIVHGGVSVLGFALDRFTGARVRTVSRLSGAGFGLIKGGMVLAFLLLFLDLFPVAPVLKSQLRDSRLARPLMALAETIVRVGTARGAGGPGHTA
jgi:membrane protein required for colicin V production